LVKLPLANAGSKITATISRIIRQTKPMNYYIHTKRNAPMRKLIPVLCLTFALPLLTFAQDTQLITLEEAISTALENNINLLQSENNLLRDDASVLRATGDFLPSLNLSSNASRQTGQQFNQAREIPRLEDFTTNSINANLSASLILFNGLQNINNLRGARSARLSAEEQHERARENVIFNTASAYLAVLLDKELLKIERENLESSSRQLEQITAQVEVGMRPIVDQFNQEAVVANNELAVIQRENSLNLNITELISILQINPLGNYEFEAPVIDGYDLVPTGYDLAELVETALANRRDLAGQEFQIMAARYALRSARGNYLPTISLNASLSSNYQDQYRERVVNEQGQIVGTTSVSFADQFFDTRINRAFGLSLNFPLFTRFANRTNEQLRKIDLKSAELQLESIRSDVYLEIRTAYNDYIAISQQLQSSEKALIAAEKAYETEQERYRVGSSTLIELTNANTEFVRASSNRVQTIYRFIFQEKLVDYFLGRISEDVSF
jgi:outer membrane protein